MYVSRLARLSVLCVALSAAAALAAEPVGIEAGGAILMNLKSESVLYVQNEDVRIPPVLLLRL